MKRAIENIVDTDKNFSMNQLADAAWPLIEANSDVENAIIEIKRLLGRNYRKLAYSILRNAFLIELVKIPKIETTKFRVRWFNQLVGDPRYCSFDECFLIAKDLLNMLPEWLNTPNHLECMELSFSNGMIPYETPLDYVTRFTQQNRLHQRGNLSWFYDELVLRTLKLRKYLTNEETSPDREFFRTVLNDKIKVKTYLTDRVLTGDHKTNREKRWETHPNSVHYAERRVCMAIEYALVTQICAFDQFPVASLRQLQDASILPANLPTALCPITGDALSYAAFRNELLNPTHGKSDFQVGHLNPLKLGNEGEAAGHTSDNISWISADGNRIQGSLSLEHVRILIQRISDNYDRHQWWPQPED
ncbi:MAG: hypothetical protein IM445_20005 [Microcystis sp. M015S1]|uniref:hypothetical protein n=1 Tax=unclassified Microcystis TaxID=2643300 RepID=UPI00258C083F|nr:MULTISPECIES: hypothetical protein [unclassified Microcystis]MCA2864960.1 hypothetical protein [Microcystis sp. M049S1]MCA2920243.1 hypothetical protein [Microcystis sp. M017S1]MCA2936908.1 hypothetical protein [Microcystis sp. M015S1]MCA2945653.1 hypothetical protein [Microcystis sp. M011S1]